MNACLINGQALSALAISDRAIAYGDGVFETIAVKLGTMPLWSAHYQRLIHACNQLALPAPSEAILLKEIDALKGDREQAVIKIIISRGSGERGYRAPEHPNSRRIIQCLPWPNYPTAYTTQGVQVIFCKTPVSQNPTLAGIKHLNRLDNVLASSEWDEKHIAEGLMCDSLGHVIGGTKTNIFYVRAGVLYTPMLKEAGVSGIMRDQILIWAQALNIETRITQVTQSDLNDAEEIFLTNSLIGIWPVTQLMDKKFPIGELCKIFLQRLN
ncbi:MAG TPA: aminodeoxychorismate lyase [Gammaproteobacteria bacterium]|nr:aminodeoxychorismate lyase [Gammaproteobacteria bacterium]